MSLLAFVIFLHAHIVMLTADERLALIRVKVERAKKHIRDLEVEVHTFLNSKPYEIGTKADPNILGLVVFYLTSVRDTPPMLAAIAGDVLYNLRSALDHLAFHLVLVNGGTPGKFTYFPISDNATKYKTEAPRKVRGMSQAAIDAINAVEPYERGKGEILWRLHRLNNIDKHRILVTVGSSLAGTSMPPLMKHVLREIAFEQSGKTITDAQIDAEGFIIKPKVHLCPLKTGDELTSDIPFGTVDQEMGFTFEIAFGEPQIAERKPLLPTQLRVTSQEKKSLRSPDFAVELLTLDGQRRT